MNDSLMIGAVAYDPKVVTIWEGFKAWFGERGNLPVDFVLYSNYEQQVAAHFAGHIHVAWNSPLAWLQARAVAERLDRRAEAIAMRDTDRDLTSVIVVRAESSFDSPADLENAVIGTGAGDSPQATLIPLLHLAEAGLDPTRQATVRPFDALLGKHGDHIGGERDAAKALMRGEIDAACMIDGNHLAFIREGTLPSSATRVLSQTGTFDHCNFTVLDGAPEAAVARFRELLLAMSYDDPSVRPLLDLEGLKQWLPGRTHNYSLLERSVVRFGTIERFVEDVAEEITARCS